MEQGGQMGRGQKKQGMTDRAQGSTTGPGPQGGGATDGGGRVGHLPSHCLKPSSPTAIWSWG